MVLRDAVEGISGADGPWLVQLATLFEQNCATLPGSYLFMLLTMGGRLLSMPHKCVDILKPLSMP